MFMCKEYIIQTCSRITHGRVLNGELIAEITEVNLFAFLFLSLSLSLSFCVVLTMPGLSRDIQHHTQHNYILT